MMIYINEINFNKEDDFTIKNQNDALEAQLETSVHIISLLQV